MNDFYEQERTREKCNIPMHRMFRKDFVLRIFENAIQFKFIL